jgi:hypothetical protein
MNKTSVLVLIDKLEFGRKIKMSNGKMSKVKMPKLEMRVKARM